MHVVFAAQLCRADVGLDWLQYNLDLLLWSELGLCHAYSAPPQPLMYKNTYGTTLVGSRNRLTPL